MHEALDLILTTATRRSEERGQQEGEELGGEEKVEKQPG